MAGMNQSTHHVYMLLCSNGSIYVGQTRNIEKRLKRHLSGEGARHTAGIRPIRLLHEEGPMLLIEAISRERQLKKWSRAKKLALAAQDFELLRKLSKTHSIPRMREQAKRDKWLHHSPCLILKIKLSYKPEGRGL